MIKVADQDALALCPYVQIVEGLLHTYARSASDRSWAGAPFSQLHFRQFFFQQLFVVQVGVVAVLGEKLVVGAEFDDAAAVEHGD